ncbi:MAG: trigger factor [Clostridia bacterium]|nr:trigger factor [Clostridia bacterium]
MSLKNTTKVETNLYEIEFDVDKATFEAAIEKVYRKEVKNINIPGFRKGKAPRSIIESRYGKGVFYEDAVNEIIPDAYEAAIKEAGLTVVSRPEFDIVTIDDNGVVLKAKFYVKPEVSVKDYKGIKVEKEVKAVTDEDVNADIEQARARNSRVVDVEGRAVENGDITVIDFDGYVDGVAFEGGKSENYNLTIGSGSFIPGFEEQIIGHNVGDHFDVNVTFPAEYHAAELAGKEAVFKIVLHAIKFNELPALDDEFAKDVSEFDTLDEYKADVKAKIEKRYEKEAENAVEGQIIDALIANLEAEIPAAMFESETENFVRDYDSRLRMQGLDLNTYFKYTGLTLESLREQFKPMAERQVKTRLALEKIVELEGITASDDEISAEYENMAKAYNMSADEIKKFVEADAVKADICVKKAVDFVKENADITTK